MRAVWNVVFALVLSGSWACSGRSVLAPPDPEGGTEGGVLPDVPVRMDVPVRVDASCGPCPSGLVCVAGICDCPPPDRDCNGRCVNVTNRADHCGVCNHQCPATTPTCVNGTCR